MVESSLFEYRREIVGQGMILHPPEGAEHKYSIVWLHGLGDTAGGGYNRMVCYSDPRAFPPNCKVILPTAPVKPVTCNNGSKSTSWYDVVTFNPKDKLTGEMMSIQDMRAKNYN